MTMRNYVIIFIVLIAGELLAQDAHFTQFTSGAEWLNPATSGALTATSAQISYRDQWSGIGDFYKSMLASGQLRIGAKKDKRGFSSAGILLLNDRAGTARLNTLNGGFNYAYHVRLDNFQTLGLGVYAGVLQHSFSPNGLQWGSQYDGNAWNSALPGDAIVGARRTNLDLAAGVCWTWKSSENYMTSNDQRMFRLGAGMWHITQPNIAFSGLNKLAPRYSVHGDALIGIANTSFSILPAVLFQQQQTSELVVGSLIRYTVKESSRYTGFVASSSVAVGAYWRNKDAIAFAAQLQWSKYSLGMSYDATVSALRQSTNGRGGFEITLSYRGS